MVSKTGFTKTFYHVSNEQFGQSIAAIGVVPAYSQGARKAIWFVPKAGIHRAILHCARRHHWHIDDLIVCVLEIPVEDVRYSGNGMFFYSTQSAEAISIQSAGKFIEDEDDIT